MFLAVSGVWRVFLGLQKSKRSVTPEGRTLTLRESKEKGDCVVFGMGMGEGQVGITQLEGVASLGPQRSVGPGNRVSG